MRVVSVQAWFTHDAVDVDPGATLKLALTVQNLGEATETYSVVPAGLSASWTSVKRGNLTLFGGSLEVIDVEISPPLLPTTTAGPTSVAVRIIPTSTEDDAIVAEAILGVQSFDDCRIVTLQPIQRARRRATFEFMVENHGNSVASARMLLVDSTKRVDGSFDPPAVGVAPGAAGLVRLKARSSRPTFRRHVRTLNFEVEAQRQGHANASAPLALVQPPTIPVGAIARAVAVAALVGAAVLAWFGVVKPTIEDSARNEVDRRVAELAPTGEPTVPAPDTTDPAVVVDPAAETGEPTFLRLSVEPPLTETADQSASIPAGEQFDLTDLRIENPYNDGGVATLLINGEPAFVWSLQNIRGQFFEPRITQIRLQSGDNITFSVRCDVIGDPTKSTCTTAINVGGLTLTPG